MQNFRKPKEEVHKLFNKSTLARGMREQARDSERKRQRDGESFGSQAAKKKI